MTIRFASAAEEDIRDIIDYVSAENPSAARKVTHKIQSRLALLEEYPLRGSFFRTKRGKLLRRLTVDSYVIFYEVDAQGVIIACVLHGARDVDSTLDGEPARRTPGED
jgi:toxin ParE1/3/4